MKKVQLQTDQYYLCFNHAVKQALAGDGPPVWAETLPKCETQRCMECALIDIEDGTIDISCADYTKKQATKGGKE